MLKIQFLGAAGTVTGSKYSITYGHHRFLVDCGLFQGADDIIRHNWDKLPVSASRYEALVLTHAHIDHSGAIPRLVGDGFDGPILCTEPTRDLCELLLPDSAKIQREDAGEEAPPFYTDDDVETALDLMEAHPYHVQVPVVDGVTVTFHDAGHIIGSAWLELVFEPLPSWGMDRPVRFVFSGDLGRGTSPILPPPDKPEQADFLVLESTYGDRLHSTVPAREHLGEAIRETARLGSTLVIPAFAVQRCQDLAYLVDDLLVDKRIEPLSLFLDSPMAARATRVFEDYPELFSARARKRFRRSSRLLQYPYLRICENAAQSRSIQDFRPPTVIVSASGMAEGGRVLHHLRRHLPDPRSCVLMAGYQCEGTRGWQLKNGAREVEIHGDTIRVRAHVDSLDGLSGHADYAEIGRWLDCLDAPPRRTFLVHGDTPALEAQEARLRQRPNWRVDAPKHRAEVILFDS